ncbi:hypothetical protein TNCV_4569661 [Trichonephila clavipes]|nr:hypothetical protein TNCV_4569661 [Trichonephila clavipes]
MPYPNCTVWCTRLETLWCSKLDHLDSIRSSGAGRVFWAEMARLRIPRTRLLFDLPQDGALAGKDAVWPCISLALPPPTPGLPNEKPLPPLSTIKAKPSRIILFMRHGDDNIFALNLSLYLGADLGDFINFMVLLRSRVNALKPSEIIALGSTVDLRLNRFTFSTITLNRRLGKEKEPFPSRVDCHRQAQTIPFGDRGLDRAGSPDSSTLDSIGSNGVGWVLWAEMARYRFSSARCMSHQPHSYTQARKNTVWTCVSQKVPLQHLDIHNTFPICSALLIEP